MGVRISFFQEEQRGLQCFPMILDMCVVEDVSMYQDIPTLEFLSTLEHPPILPWIFAVVASAACPSQSSNLEMTSITFGGSHL